MTTFKQFCGKVIRQGMQPAVRRLFPVIEPAPAGRVDYRIDTPIHQLVEDALNYAARLECRGADGRFLGHKFAASTTRPVLYGTVAAVLLKHLCGRAELISQEEIELIHAAQATDGLFRDPVIACPEAEQEDWWGSRHLTLHALMALALTDRTARYEPVWICRSGSVDAFRARLDALDWGTRVAFTSNALQNLGVALQYARDFQEAAWPRPYLEILFAAIDAHQDPATGLYGQGFATPRDRSEGVQAGYHFWLLHAYDRRPIPYAERIVDSVLATQNPRGGFGVLWRSSACEDMDSLDPLYRLSQVIPYRRAEVERARHQALGAVLANVNQDGGWVFRRCEPLQYGWSSQTAALPDESNLFFTWFRMLGLAYSLLGSETPGPTFQYPWNFKHVPGLQFV